MPEFYRDIVQSVYIDWFTEEYSTINFGGNQEFGRGLLNNVTTITPRFPDQQQLTLDDVDAELDAQIGDGNLPQPGTNSIYMVHLPPGYTVSYNYGQDTCGCGQHPGFHEWFNPTAGITRVRFGVVADQSCLSTNEVIQFDNVTVTAAHEIAEIETDPDKQDATDANDYEAWDYCGYGRCEIADQCQGTIATTLPMNHARPEIPNRNYFVQAEFSNEIYIQQGPSAACIKSKHPSTFDLIFRNGSSLESLLMVDNWTSVVSLQSQAINWTYIGVGDFNADGWSDIAWRDSNTGNIGLTFYQNGGFFGTHTIPPEASTYLPKAIGDVNGDGISDIIWYAARTGDIRIWLMNGDGTINKVAFPGAVSAGAATIATGDFNRDGNADIFFRIGTSTVIWLMNGGTRISSISPGAAGVNFAFLGVADFNNDGMSDIAWKDTYTNSVVFWWLDAGMLVTTKTLQAPPPADQTILGVQDVNGDGVSDVVFRDTRAGAISAWQMTLSGGEFMRTGQLAIPLSWSFVGFASVD